MLTFDDKRYKPDIFVSDLRDAGVDPTNLLIETNDDGHLFVTVRVDDPDGTIAQAVRGVTGDAHDATQLSEGERYLQDRAAIRDQFDLDASDRAFIRDLSQVLTLAETNTVSASRAYDEIRAVVIASNKHRGGVAYWYDLEYGINLLNGVTLTIQNKRDFIKCVRRYYASKLAPALIVWLTR